MKKGIKTFFKVIGFGIALLLLLIIVFVLLNLTLVKNLPSAQEGFADAMFIDNQKPLQLIKGAQNAALTLNQKDPATFSQTHDYWEKRQDLLIDR